MRPTQILSAFNSHIVKIEEPNMNDRFSYEEINAQARILIYFLYCCMPMTVIRSFLEMIGADFDKYTAVANSIVSLDD